MDIEPNLRRLMTEQGRRAYEVGLSLEDNPYPEDNALRDSWDDGWRAAHSDPMVTPPAEPEEVPPLPEWLK